MQIRATYSRVVKTSRRFVFENIMDLEHVCVLHRKWFRNLRVRVNRPDYVEYRLTSLFYGLSQELLVRGGPVDASHYWYEFIGPLATIRVDGKLDGPDGSLTQTEEITYAFKWYLAPFFWLLKPLFRRQKDNILHDDSSLLERVYALEQQGFHRLELAAPKVVVYGGDGFFGRLVVQDLLKHSCVNVVIASRQPNTSFFQEAASRATFYQSDLNDYASVLATIDGAQLVICCAGPFQGMGLNLLRACIEKQIHYIDIADDRDFVERAYTLTSAVRASGITALVGCSVVPGLSSLLTEYCRQTVGDVRRTRIFITPGTKNPRGNGSFACLLTTAGKAFQIPCGGGMRTVTGWSGRERVEFPPPIGSRAVYFVVDIADYWTQRHYFGADTIEFKIGSEMEFLNRSLGLLRWARVLLRLEDTKRLLVPSRLLVQLAAPFGSTQGALMLGVTGSQGQVWISVYAEERGERIPALLPSIAAQMILAGELNRPGIPPLPTWLPFVRLLQELGKRHVRAAVRSEGAEWQEITAAFSRDGAFDASAARAR
jgi:hypothetical protein